jgi:putative hydrolase of HD superfamily
MRERAEQIVKYYALCNRLKNTIRTGWIEWHVRRDRIESVAEHIYSTQMLAIAMASEYEYDLDLFKVIFMLAIHEIGETVIGDLTPFQIDPAKKQDREHRAVHEILSGMLSGDEIEKLFLEFDAHKTKEAFFAWQCDKLECDLQCRLYDEEGCVDLKEADCTEALNDPVVSRLLSDGKSWSEVWLGSSRQSYPYDKNFREVLDYAMTHRIGEGQVFSNARRGSLSSST